MSNTEGVFRFDLNESLYFDSGQEVAEMIGVSLEPEIAIQTFHEYISIRGVIELSGDYHKVPLSGTLDKPPLEMDDIHEKSFIEQVNDRTDSLASFTHRFPVEISVPAYRVDDLEEVTVQVASFDYEIPNHHQMKLMAVIEIEGINGEAETPSAHEEQSVMPLEEEESSVEEMKESDSAHDVADATSPFTDTEEEIEEIERIEEADEVMDEKSEPPEPDQADSNMEESLPEESMAEEPQEKEEDTSAKEKQEKDKKEHKKDKKSLPLSDFFKKEERVDTEEKETQTETAEEELEMEDAEEPEELIKTNESSRESEQNSTPIDSLSEMFEHDEQEKYTKMRLCIVQDNDTVEKIAERYETTPNQLLHNNRLSDEESITEGQLLYIPEKAKK